MSVPHPGRPSRQCRFWGESWGKSRVKSSGESRSGPPHRYRGQRGITLIELITVLTVAAILAAIALPNMSEFMKNNARSTRLNDLVTAINFARSTAITQGVPAAFCASNAAGTTCSATVTDFANGVLVVQANSATVSRTALPVATTNTSPWRRVRVIAGSPAATFRMTGDTAFVVFEPSGMPSAAVANVKFVHCDNRDGSSPKHARAIVLSATGHPAISHDSDDDGTHDINTVELTCPTL